jgi:hypothetical protein
MTGYTTSAAVAIAPLSNDEAAQLFQAYDAAKKKRMIMESLFSECYDWTLPARSAWFGGSQGQPRTDHIFDETACVSVQEFASRLATGLFPAFRRWADLRPGSDVVEGDKVAISQELEVISKVLFEAIDASNFAQEIHEALLDLAVSTGILLIETGADGGLQFTALPMPAVVLDVGPNDQVDALFRELERKIAHLEVLWPGRVKLPRELETRMRRDPEATVKLIEICRRDWIEGVETYDYRVLEWSTRQILVSGTYKGEGSCPFVAFRFSKAAGEVWGRGPVINALPAIRTCNFVQRLVLENADMAIAGIWQAEDDGVLNPDTVSLVPGTVIPKGAGSGLQPLKPAGQFDVSTFVLKDQRAAIKKALYNETLGPREGTPMSATEVNERIADLARQMGSAFGRLQSEAVQPILRRCLYLLAEAGRIMLPRVGSKLVEIRSSSPLARDQEMADVVGVDRWLEILMNRYGPQMVNLLSDSQAIAEFTAQKLGVPPSLVRSKLAQQKLAATVQSLAGQANAAAPPPEGGLP